MQNIFQACLKEVQGMKIVEIIKLDEMNNRTQTEHWRL